jgi:hypothetical protein
MGVFLDVESIAAVESAVDKATEQAETLAVVARKAKSRAMTMRAEVEADPSCLAAVGEEARVLWRELIEAGFMSDPAPKASAPVTPERKSRGPDRAPRKRKEGSVSEPKGTPPEQIGWGSAELLRVLAAGPLTLPWIAAGVSFTTGVGVTQEEANRRAENALTNDPDRFVGWRGRREGDSEDVELWGTREQFYAVAQRLIGTKRASVPQLMDTLRCGAAAAAWAIDRAVAEASGA